MAGVNIPITANALKASAEIERFRKQSNSAFNNIGQGAQKMGQGVADGFSNPQSAIQGFLSRLGPVGGVAAGVGIALGGMSAAALAAGNAVMVPQKQLEAMAKTSGLSVEAMNQQAIAASTVGVSMEQLGDILKDVNDKTGDFVSTGGGALQDYFDTIKGKINRTADDFRGLGSMQVLKMVQADLDQVGASASQQVFVLESLASDASKLGPLLRMNEQEVKNMLDGYAVQRATLSQDTINDIQKTQNNIDMLQNNFNAALANSFSGLISLSSEMSKRVSDLLYEVSEGAKKQNVIRAYSNGDMKVNAANAQGFIDNADEIRSNVKMNSRARATREVEGLPFGDEYWKKVDELTNKYIDEANHKIDVDLAKAKDFKNAETISSKSTGTAGAAKAPDTSTATASIASLKSLQDQRTSLMREQGRLETQLQNTQGEESRKALEGQITNQKALLEANAENIKAVNTKIAGYNAEAYSKRQTALSSLAATEQQIAQYGYEKQLEQLKSYLQEGSLTQSEFNEAKLIAEKQLSDKLVDIKKKELDEKRKLAQQEYNDRVSQMNTLKDFATTQEDVANQELLIKRAAIEEAFRLDQEKGEYSILTEQDKNNKLAEIDREYELQRIERQNEHMASREEAQVLYYEQEKALLEEQRENGLISQDEYNTQILESDKSLTSAKRDLAMAQLGTISELFRNSAQLAEQGSKQAKVLFAMEKASTIASLGIEMWEKWGKAENWGEKAMVIAQYGGAIASAGAVTLGQFHSGTDEVSETGSYILKSGERVIQPEANKDLTAYLENKKGSGDITVNSDFIYNNNGGGGSDENAESEYYKHRDVILKAINLAKREQGF
ncbi:hypothetical protein [Aeromonas sp.]|uniref:hypothetical protein n=1 Tax=Aeromonas sp. TaxID=647 RepID=UPI00291401DB|nr:hypothetical protein [Aeromonas sp.]MDU7582319.1 hypothetical protein [Aeromonas sp.]